jgi:hypothetical protein
MAGKIAKRGTNKEWQIVPFVEADTPDLQNLMGVVLLSTSRPLEQLSSSGIVAGNTCSVLRKGTVYMAFSAAVTAGQRVGHTQATGVLTGLDQGASPGAGVVVVPGLRIAETIGAAGVAIVEVDL